MVKIYLANVGVNRRDEKRGIMSPLLTDNTFEFIPIKESKSNLSENMITYQQIKTFNSDKSLAYYLPEKVHNYIAHNDPEFVTYTYGDVIKNPRSSNLQKIQKGDYLFFLARLTPYKGKKFIKSEGGFYLVGYFLVEGLYQTEKELNENKHKIKNNAHFIRYKNNFEQIGDFIIIKGDEDKSKRFVKPIIVNRDFCKKFILDAKGKPLIWKEKSKDNQVIGSYTRTIRAILDSEIDYENTNAFLKYVDAV